MRQKRKKKIMKLLKLSKKFEVRKFKLENHEEIAKNFNKGSVKHI